MIYITKNTNNIKKNINVGLSKDYFKISAKLRNVVADNDDRRSCLALTAFSQGESTLSKSTIM